MEPRKYGYEKRLEGISFDEARSKVVEALAAEGFGVLSEIDVGSTLKKKLDVSFRPYVILGACNPKLAYRALQADDQIGLLLPCNVVIQEVDGGLLVSIAKPSAMFDVVGNPALEPVASEADERLQRVIAALG